MPAVQHILSFARPLAARVRSVRRPFQPSPGEEAYRLPHDIRNRLTAALAPFRNREAAYALATFIARFWSVPGRVALAFPIDRRALADRPDLGLTEKRVRSAIVTLEAVGFLERSIPSAGSAYKATPDGLHRKPILFVFGPEYAPAFLAANSRARKARGRVPGARRPLHPSQPQRPSTPLPRGQNFSGPKNKREAETQVIMGPLSPRIGIPAEPSAPTALDLALQRLSEGVFGKPRVE